MFLNHIDPLSLTFLFLAFYKEAKIVLEATYDSFYGLFSISFGFFLLEIGSGYGHYRLEEKRDF